MPIPTPRPASSEANAFWADEPFNRAGVYDWTMERWRFGHV
jgi:hypothetical protein